MSDISSITPSQGSLRGSDPRKPSRKPLAGEVQRYVLGAVLIAILIAFALALAIRWFSAAEPQEVELTIAPGESLAELVGYPAAIEIAEENGLPITAKLISPTLSAADARKVEPATDVVRVRVGVMPGAKISMTVDSNGVRVPDTPIIYTPAPR